MTSKLKCPFCQQELCQDYTGVMYCCNEECEQSADWYGSQILWQALIQAKQDLERAEDTIVDLNTIQEAICAKYAQSKKSAKIARKALKDARIFADTHCIATAVKTIDKALEQIDHIADASKMVEHKE